MLSISYHAHIYDVLHNRLSQVGAQMLSTFRVQCADVSDFITYLTLALAPDEVCIPICSVNPLPL